ncbi:MAG: copper resistance CopC family protein, partial [Steroidobacteraceae bacterium]
IDNGDQRMKVRLFAIASAVSAFAGLAQAHTHLESAMPADNSVLTSAPSQIMLHFSEPTRLTALTVQKDGEKEHKHIDALPKDASDALAIPVAPLAPGKYLVNWRVVGDDNHVMSGALHFTITGK